MTTPLLREAHPDVEMHTWRLSNVEFEDGVTIRCFECAACGAVRYD